MPRLMMSRPWAASALARASTAKAFSSPMRSKLATVFSMACPRVFHALCAAAPAATSTVAAGASGPAGQAVSGSCSAVPSDLQFRHPQDFKDDGDRPANQQQPVERHDRTDQAPTVAGHYVAIPERHVVLESKLEGAGIFDGDA